MKLTNYQREAIVSAIFQDVPQPDNGLIREQAQAALVAAMSPLVQQVYATTPKALSAQHVYFIFNRRGYELIVGDADLDEVLKPWVEAKDRYNATKNKLAAIVKGCSSLKQLNDRLPEFAKHFPKETETLRNLPAISGVVADMVKLGWVSE